MQFPRTLAHENEGHAPNRVAAPAHGQTSHAKPWAGPLSSPASRRAGHAAPTYKWIFADK